MRIWPHQFDCCPSVVIIRRAILYISVFFHLPDAFVISGKALYMRKPHYQFSCDGDRVTAFAVVAYVSYRQQDTYVPHVDTGICGHTVDYVDDAGHGIDITSRFHPPAIFLYPNSGRTISRRSWQASACR